MDNHNEAEDALVFARQRLLDREVELGLVLRRAREERGLSLRGCAKEIGVSAMYLCDVERGRRAISTGNLEVYIGILLPSCRPQEVL